MKGQAVEGSAELAAPCFWCSDVPDDLKELVGCGCAAPAQEHDAAISEARCCALRRARRLWPAAIAVSLLVGACAPMPPPYPPPRFGYAGPYYRPIPPPPPPPPPIESVTLHPGQIVPEPPADDVTAIVPPAAPIQQEPLPPPAPPRMPAETPQPKLVPGGSLGIGAGSAKPGWWEMSGPLERYLIAPPTAASTTPAPAEAPVLEPAPDLTRQGKAWWEITSFAK